MTSKVKSSNKKRNFFSLFDQLKDRSTKKKEQSGSLRVKDLAEGGRERRDWLNLFSGLMHRRPERKEKEFFSTS